MHWNFWDFRTPFQLKKKFKYWCFCITWKFGFYKLKVSFLYEFAVSVPGVKISAPGACSFIYWKTIWRWRVWDLPARMWMDFPELSITECKIDTETVWCIIFSERCFFRCVNRTFFSLDTLWKHNYLVRGRLPCPHHFYCQVQSSSNFCEG